MKKLLFRTKEQIFPDQQLLPEEGGLIGFNQKPWTDRTSCRGPSFGPSNILIVWLFYCEAVLSIKRPLRKLVKLFLQL